MAGYTYPIAHPEGVLSTEELHRLLQSPKLISKRIAQLADQKFIGDYLLVGKLDARGGGIFYENGDEVIFADHTPEAVAPGSEYPRASMGGGTASAARTVKWGLETGITDEKIAREGQSHVDRGLTRLANSVVRHVDSVALAVVASKVTSAFAAPGAWSTTGAIAQHLINAQQERAELGTGLELDTVLLRPAQWAKLVGMLIDDKALPREAGNIVVTGTQPISALGFTWVTSPHYKSANPLLLDREQLGGMADEKLGSPGYHAAGPTNVESLTKRDDSNDSYDLRSRRVTVPVVLDALAGAQLTGTGL